MRCLYVLRYTIIRNECLGRGVCLLCPIFWRMNSMDVPKLLFSHRTIDISWGFLRFCCTVRLLE